MSQSTTPGSALPQPERDGKRVVVAMSGGVDSSVAAALLVEWGYDVIGMMMRLWSEPSSGQHGRLNRCCTPDQMADARRIAQYLNIPFYVVDAQQFFYDSVVRYFVDQHLEGRTPNPCIECNRRVRFDYLLERALALEADYLATGHYARVSREGAEYQLLKSADDDKDQSYVLHVLGQSELARVLFPVGDYTKDQVRDLARQLGLPLVAGKSESMDLCFLADGDYRRFLRQQAPLPIAPGPIVNRAGEVLGQHNGLTDFTIGQRKGLGLAVGQPLYVLAKDRRRNALIVGDIDALGQTEMWVKNVNWISGASPTTPAQLDVKIRYRANPVPATLTPVGNDRAEVSFTQPVRGATSGQGAVFYAGQRCLGGGIICDKGWT
ncbi:MAG: tRNA 2-thiouridine(34) synthase MnmA [Candidatus Promineifilaceae bacterium]